MATRDRAHRTPDACSRRPELPKRLREALAARAFRPRHDADDIDPMVSLATGMLWLKDVGECVRAAEMTKAKQERRVSEPGRNLSYGDYILRTGRGIIEAYRAGLWTPSFTRNSKADRASSTLARVAAGFLSRIRRR